MESSSANGSKDRILARIREALQTPAPERHLNAPAGVATRGIAPESDSEATARDWLPPVPDDHAGRIALLEKNSEALKTRIIRCANAEALTNELRNLASSERWKRIAAHQFPLGHPAILASGLEVTWLDHGYEVSDLESADAGITGCECLVCQTGSILVTAASSGGRTLSVLPPHHVVIARESQVVGDLSDALAVVKASHHGEVPAFLSFITGPSRTGDIERILVLGAHGPKQLTVLLVADET